jgi:hypothetical protein
MSNHRRRSHSKITATTCSVRSVHFKRLHLGIRGSWASIITPPDDTPTKQLDTGRRQRLASLLPIQQHTPGQGGTYSSRTHWPPPAPQHHPPCGAGTGPQLVLQVAGCTVLATYFELAGGHAVLGRVQGILSTHDALTAASPGVFADRMTAS